MKYSVKHLAELSGVSTRTLRYYDQVDLLKPAGYTEAGYRVYGESEIDRLQQILLYRELGMKLDDIKKIVDKPDFDTLHALQNHYKALQEEQKKINQMIATVEKTIQHQKGEIEMTANEKFEGFKKKRLEENEEMYGEEIREKYGETTVDESNRKFMNLSEADFNQMQEIEERLFDQLDVLSNSKDLTSQEAENVYLLHKEWLMYSWPKYSTEAHRGLVQMYMSDERFQKYYNDRAGKEAVSLLHDAVMKYTESDE